MKKFALILFSHGARDPGWAAPLHQLREMIQDRQPGIVVELAFLELMNPRLPETVKKLADEGCVDVTVVPVFLGQGGHVLRDLPPMVEQLKLEHPGLSIRIAPAVGESREVLDAIAQYCIGASPGKA